MEARTELAKNILLCGAKKSVIVRNLISQGFKTVRDLGLFREPDGYGESDFEAELGWLLEKPLQELEEDDWNEVQGQASFKFTL